MSSKRTLFPALFFFLVLGSCTNSEPESDLTFDTAPYDQYDEQKEQQKILEKQKEDSLKLYYHSFDSLFQAQKFEKAILQLDTALHFCTKRSRDSIQQLRAELHFQLKHFESATKDYSSLIQRQYMSAHSYYHRAECYLKMDSTQKAVDDLKEAISLNHPTASELHDKVNPEKKRVSHYVTRCCDGSISHSTGRGTCSHHGGVCNWSEAVYETYREY